MSLKSSGTNISACEVTDINKNGIWVLIDDKEYFISFSDYPIFKNMSVKDIFDFEYYPQSRAFVYAELPAVTFQ